MPQALSVFYPFITPHVLGVPTPLLDQAIRFSATEFCRATHAVASIETQNLEAGVTDYDVDVPTYMDLTAVKRVWVQDSELEVAGSEEVHSGIAVRGTTGDETAFSGTPTVFFQKSPYDPVITLYPVPDTDVEAGLAIRAAYQPRIDAPQLADQLFYEHVNDVAAGAIAYLMGLPGQDFSNSRLAQDYSKRFMRAIEQAKPVAQQGHIRRSLRVQSRDFA